MIKFSITGPRPFKGEGWGGVGDFISFKKQNPLCPAGHLPLGYKMERV